MALNVGERCVIGSLPFVRLGLANAATVVVLIAYGARYALAVTVGRVVVASLLTGTFMGPTFAIGLGGAVGAWATMAAARLVGRWVLGPLGLSVLGAFAHNVSQIGVASFVLLGTWELASLWPLIALVSAGAGCGTGLLALAMGRALFAEGAVTGRLAVEHPTECTGQAVGARSRPGSREIDNRQSAIAHRDRARGPAA